MKVLFCDIDGTLTTTISGATFKQSPDDIKILKGADRAIAYHSQKGYLIVGISNQGGVGAGHKTIEDAIAEMQNTLNLFPQLESIFFCPDFDGRICWEVGRGYAPRETRSFKFGESWNNETFFAIISHPEQTRLNFRKPEPGMVEYSYGTLSTDRGGIYQLSPPSECLLVGDRSEDRVCAICAGVNFLDADTWRSQYS